LHDRNLREYAGSRRLRRISIFQCPFAQNFQRALQFDLPEDITTAALDQLPRPGHVPSMHFETLILLCCWQLWKRRNGVVFREEHKTLRQMLMACKADAALWRCRVKQASVV